MQTYSVVEFRPPPMGQTQGPRLCLLYSIFYTKHTADRSMSGV